MLDCATYLKVNIYIHIRIVYYIIKYHINMKVMKTNTVFNGIRFLFKIYHCYSDEVLLCG